MPTMRQQLEERYGITMTTTEVSEVMKCHPSHVRSMCEHDELPAVRIGNRWYIITYQLANLLDPHGCVYD